MGRKIDVTGTGTVTCDTIVNYPLSFAGSEVQNLVIQEVASGDRWDVHITDGSKEYSVRFEAELVSGLPFWLACGSVQPTLDGYPRTITPCATLTSCTITAESESDTMSVEDCKCTRLALNWGAGEFITYELEAIGLGTISATVGGTVDWSVEALTCASLEVVLDGTTLGEMQSGNMEINNNLESRYACGKGKDPQTIREQRLEVTGALTVGQSDISNFTTGGHSMDIHIKGLGLGGITIQVGSIWFDELPDEFTGHDVYEIEFSWTAQPISGGVMLNIIDATSVNVW